MHIQIIWPEQCSFSGENILHIGGDGGELKFHHTPGRGASLPPQKSPPLEDLKGRHPLAQ